MKKKTKIILILLLLIIIAIAVVVAILFNQNSDNKKTEAEVEWGDIYLTLLEDEGNFEDLDDIKIQFCDLDNNEVPELVMFGTESSSNVMRIYSIEDEKAKMSSSIELQDDSSYLELLENTEAEEYDWYLVTSDETVYDFSLEGTTKKLSKSYDDFDVVISDDDNPVIDFDAKASKSDKKEIVESAKENYTPLKDVLPKNTKLKRQNKSKESATFEIEIEPVTEKLESDYGHFVINWTYSNVTVTNDDEPEIAEKIETFLNEETGDPSREEFKEELSEYIAYDTEDSVSSEEHSMEESLEVVIQTEKLLSIRYTLVGNMGGVPWDNNLGYVLNLETGEAYGLEDITENYSSFENKIIELASVELDNTYGLSNLDSDYETKLKNYIETTGQWFFTDDGIEIFIPRYGIGAGALGTPIIDISYDDISSYLTDEILEALELSKEEDEDTTSKTTSDYFTDNDLEKKITEYAKTLVNNTWDKEANPDDLEFCGYEDSNLTVEVAVSPSGNVYCITSKNDDSAGLVTCIDGSDERYPAGTDVKDIDSMWTTIKGYVGFYKNDKISIFYLQEDNTDDKYTRYDFTINSDGSVTFDEKSEITGFNNLYF